MPSAVALLEPIHAAQLGSIRLSRVISMDETPIKAGRAGPGKMKSAYFWPVYGEQDEICFLYYPSRAAKHVADALGLSPPPGAVLHRWLQRLCAACKEDGHDPRPVLGAFETQAHRGAGY